MIASPKRTSHAIIKLNDAWKTYQMGSEQIDALSDVSISFRAGSFWAIMGPSGSGKSTMMNVLGCLDRLTAGQYLLQEQDVSNFDDDALSEIRLRNLGFIFQSFNLIPQLTVRRNIELPLYYLGWSDKRRFEKVTELAESVGLETRLGHRPAELSGGQMQRVAIARALANDPSIILADEPTGNLDSSTGRNILKLLKTLHQQGKTIIMVTHDVEVAAYAHSRLYLKDGAIDCIDGEVNDSDQACKEHPTGD